MGTRAVKNGRCHIEVYRNFLQRRPSFASTRNAKGPCHDLSTTNIPPVVLSPAVAGAKTSPKSKDSAAGVWLA